MGSYFLRDRVNSEVKAVLVLKDGLFLISIIFLETERERDKERERLEKVKT